MSAVLRNNATISEVEELRDKVMRDEEKFDEFTARWVENTLDTKKSISILYDIIAEINKQIRTIVIAIFCTVVLLAIFMFLTARKVSGYEYTSMEMVDIGMVVNHEAKNESELGKRLVIDTILNRVESDGFPNTVEGVLRQQGQYCNPSKFPDDKDIYRLIAEEIYNRTNSKVLWYRTNKYHTYGNPIVTEGNHYFSGR